jgi:hypothetical protein
MATDRHRWTRGEFASLVEAARHLERWAAGQRRAARPGGQVDRQAAWTEAGSGLGLVGTFTTGSDVASGQVTGRRIVDGEIRFYPAGYAFRYGDPGPGLVGSQLGFDGSRVGPGPGLVEQGIGPGPGSAREADEPVQGPGQPEQPGRPVVDGPRSRIDVDWWPEGDDVYRGSDGHRVEPPWVAADQWARSVDGPPLGEEVAGSPPGEWVEGPGYCWPVSGPGRLVDATDWQAWTARYAAATAELDRIEGARAARALARAERSGADHPSWPDVAQARRAVTAEWQAFMVAAGDVRRIEARRLVVAVRETGRLYARRVGFEAGCWWAARPRPFWKG